MDVTPQVLHDVEFREAKRGYHTGDVDDFLEKLAVGVEQLQGRLAEAVKRLEAAEARAGAAEARAQEAERRANDRNDADETLKRTLVLAQRTADAAVKEAEDQAGRTLSSAQEQANRLLGEAHDALAKARAEAETEARRTHEHVRAQVLAEVHELEAVRDQLRDQVGAFEHHLEAQRAQVGHTIEELRRLLEDPGALAEVPAPEAPPVVIPESDIFEPQVAPEPEPDAEPAVAAEPAGFEAPPRPLVAPPVPDRGEDVAPGASDEQPSVAEAERRRAERAPGRSEPGPPTEPVDVLADRDLGDDEYLAELRKAMSDESPLGSRDEDASGGADPAELFDQESDRAGRSRFGRRR